MVSAATIEILRCPLCQALLEEQSDALRCLGCSNVFKRTREKLFFIAPSEDITPTLRKKPTDKKQWTKWRLTNFDFFKKQLETIPREQVVLDLGTGQAQFAEILESFPRLITTDFYPYEKVEIVCDFTKSLPFHDQTINCITASNVFEHIPNTKEVFGECFRVLKPGGTFFGTIPFLLNVHQKPYDFVRYTYFMMEKLLREAGFEQIEVLPLGNSYDAYFQSQRRFFFMLFDATDKQTNFFSKKSWWYGIKALWIMQRAFNWLFQSIFNRCPTTPDFTMGYGFTAVKSKSL